MRARDWFEAIRSEVLECARLEDDLLELRAQTGPRGQSYEMVAHSSGTSDGSAPILRVAQAEQELDVRQARCDAMIDDAMVVLYGEDGRGGLARLMDSATADCIYGRYLMGMKWQEVANEITRPESESPEDWCRMRARRGFERIDSVGIGALTKS